MRNDPPLKQAVEATTPEPSGRDRHMHRLHQDERLPQHEVGRRFGVSRQTVSRAVARVKGAD